MTANVYIDGFNVYFCALKSTPYKWLNPLTLCNQLFPTTSIHKIKYFTAKVKPLPHDPSAPTRQDVYWRALKTINNLEIIQGNFVAWPKSLPLIPLTYPHGPTHPPQKVQVLRSEEKGSDVNLAAFLVFDNCQKDADESIVISNDSDLVRAISLVTCELNRPVTVVNPNRTLNVRRDRNHYGMHRELQRVASRSILSINEKLFLPAQFPPTMTDAVGTFSKPATW